MDGNCAVGCGAGTVNIFGDFEIFTKKKHMQSLKMYHQYCIHIHNLADTDYELPEDDAIASKHVGAV